MMNARLGCSALFGCAALVLSGLVEAAQPLPTPPETCWVAAAPIAQAVLDAYSVVPSDSVVLIPYSYEKTPEAASALIAGVVNTETLQTALEQTPVEVLDAAGNPVAGSITAVDVSRHVRIWTPEQPLDPGVYTANLEAGGAFHPTGCDVIFDAYAFSFEVDARTVAELADALELSLLGPSLMDLAPAGCCELSMCEDDACIQCWDRARGPSVSTGTQGVATGYFSVSSEASTDNLVDTGARYALLAYDEEYCIEFYVDTWDGQRVRQNSECAVAAPLEPDLEVEYRQRVATSTCTALPEDIYPIQSLYVVRAQTEEIARACLQATKSYPAAGVISTPEQIEAACNPAPEPTNAAGTLDAEPTDTTEPSTVIGLQPLPAGVATPGEATSDPSSESGTFPVGVAQPGAANGDGAMRTPPTEPQSETAQERQFRGDSSGCSIRPVRSMPLSVSALALVGLLLLRRRDTGARLRS